MSTEHVPMRQPRLEKLRARRGYADESRPQPMDDSIEETPRAARRRRAGIAAGPSPRAIVFGLGLITMFVLALFPPHQVIEDDRNWSDGYVLRHTWDGHPVAFQVKSAFVLMPIGSATLSGPLTNDQLFEKQQTELMMGAWFTSLVAVLLGSLGVALMLPGSRRHA